MSPGVGVGGSRIPGSGNDKCRYHEASKCVSVRARMQVFSRVELFRTLWTVAHQAPLSVNLSRQEY